MSSNVVETDTLYIPRFPVEVTEKILSYCHGTTLLKAMVADKICKSIIEERTNWQHKCKMEIPAWLLRELLLEMHPKHWFIDEKISWIEIYKTWVLWNQFTPSRPEKLTELTSFIQCLEVSGAVAFVGHSKGVQSFNLNTTESQIIYHGISVAAMELFCMEGAPMEKHEIIPGCLHDRVDLQLEPKFHFIIDLRKRYHFTQKFFPERERVLTKYDKNATLHLRMFHPTFVLVLNGKFKCKFNVEALDISNGMCLYDNTISYFHKGLQLRILRFDFGAPVPSLLSNKPSMPADCSCSCLASSAFRLTYWKCGVFFGVSMCKRLYINIKNSSSYVFARDKALTAIALCQNWLLLGTDVGYIFMYRINELDDLLCLDLDCPKHQVDVDDSAIKVIRCYQDKCRLGLAVATKFRLYRIVMGS